MIKVVILNEIDFKIPMIGKNKLNKIYTYILPVPSLMASALENEANVSCPIHRPGYNNRAEVDRQHTLTKWSL